MFNWQDNPFADLVPGAQQPRGRDYPTSIQGPPPIPTPQTPEQRGATSAQTRRDTVAADRMGIPDGYERAPDGSIRPMQGSPAARDAARGGLTPNEYQGLRSRYNGLAGFRDTLREVERIYRESFEGPDRGGILGMGGETNAGGALWSRLRPSNQTFQQAAGRLVDQIAQVYGITGGEMNSLAELRARLGPYIPDPTDNDATLQSKIQSLRGIFEEQRGLLEAQMLPEHRRNDLVIDLQQQQRPHQGVSSGGGGGDDQIELEVGIGVPPGWEAIEQPDGSTILRNPQTGETRVVPPAAPPQPIENRIGASLSRGAIQALGAPVDLVNGALGTVGLGGDNPIGGSRWIDQAIYALPNSLFDRNDSVYSPRLAPQSYGEQLAQTGGEFLGSGAVPLAGLFGRGSQLGSRPLPGGPGGTIGGAVDNLARSVVSNPRTALAAEVGAAGGATLGGALVRDGLGGGPIATTIGQTLGGLGGGGISALATNRFTPQARPPMHPAYEAAQRQDMTDALLPADVGARRGPAQRLTSGFSQTVGGGGTVETGARRLNDVLGNAFDDMANRAGSAPGDRQQRGAQARRALEGFYRRTGQEGGDAIEAGIAGGTRKIGAWRALRNIDQQLNELAPTANTDADVIAGLQRLRADIVRDGELNPLGLQSARRLQSTVRSMARSDNLRTTDFERRAGMVVRDLRQDIESSIPAQSRADFRRGDRQWRVRSQVRDEVIRPLVGGGDNASDEVVGRRVFDLVFGNSRNLVRTLRSVRPEEAGDIRAGIIDNLGRANRSKQDASGGVFSAETFLSNWADMPQRSRNALFPDPAQRRAVQDLAEMASARRISSETTNFSQTSGATNAQGKIGHAMSGILGTVSLGSTLVLENVTARMLTSPKVTRWLAQGRRARDPRQHAARLSGIAASEPGLATDIYRLQEVMLRAANDNAFGYGGNVAASGDERRRY